MKADALAYGRRHIMTIDQKKEALINAEAFMIG
jgi:hypothetical protein